MSNKYGTKEYENYINEYLFGFEFHKESEMEIHYKDYKIIIEQFSSKKQINGILNARRKPKITIQKSGVECYNCECADYVLPPYCFEKDGVDYMFFRKTLYGYSILNLHNFSEINYFPSCVLEGEEAFIITQAKLWNDILILNGCYWASYDDVFLLSLWSMDTYSVRELIDRENNFEQSTIDEKAVTFSNVENKETFTYLYNDLVTASKNSHTKDL